MCGAAAAPADAAGGAGGAPHNGVCGGGTPYPVSCGPVVTGGGYAACIGVVIDGA